jgi:hypothetical protein
VNTNTNIHKRKKFAEDLIEILEKGFSVYNLDESGFNNSNSWRKGWIKKGSRVRTMRIREFANITLTSIISMEGDHFFTFLKQSNN